MTIGQLLEQWGLWEYKTFESSGHPESSRNLTRRGSSLRFWVEQPKGSFLAQFHERAAPPKKDGGN